MMNIDVVLLLVVSQNWLSLKSPGNLIFFMYIFLQFLNQYLTEKDVGGWLVVMERRVEAFCVHLCQNELQ